jgi:hypothetical protein
MIFRVRGCGSPMTSADLGSLLLIDGPVPGVKPSTGIAISFE